MINAHQTNLRTTTPDKKNNIAIFDNLDGQRYPRDSVLINYEEIEYIQQYRELELLFKVYIGEPILNPFISYPDRKTKYPIEIIDLRHQPDHIAPKKIQLCQEYGTDRDNAWL